MNTLWIIALVASVVAQPPGPPGSSDDNGSGSSSACDECGGSASYAEAITTDSGYEKRTITTSGCPNHYSICTGKSAVSVCGDVGEEGSASEATQQNFVIEIPAEPVIATSTTDLTCEMSDIAIALNGVAIFSGSVSTTCTLLDVDNSENEWTGFDFCSGHAEMTGMYHYHFPPSCLLDQAGTATGADASTHSPQIGWAYDGFPIYGPLGLGGNAMTHTDQGCTGDYCLDSCSGQEQELPSVDSFKYRYYFTGATSDLSSLPSDPKPAASDYPFSLNCNVGCTWAELSSDNSKCTGGSSGIADGYAAVALEGYAEAYTTDNEWSCAADATSPAPSPLPTTSSPTTPLPSAQPTPTPPTELTVAVTFSGFACADFGADEQSTFKTAFVQALDSALSPVIEGDVTCSDTRRRARRAMLEDSSATLTFDLDVDSSFGEFEDIQSEITTIVSSGALASAIDAETDDASVLSGAVVTDVVTQAVPTAVPTSNPTSMPALDPTAVPTVAPEPSSSGGVDEAGLQHLEIALIAVALLLCGTALLSFVFCRSSSKVGKDDHGTVAEAEMGATRSGSMI